MKTLKDQIIEDISAEIRAELIKEIMHDDSLRDAMTALREKIREEIQTEIDEEEAAKFRSEIADAVYESEAEEIRSEAIKQLAKERENLRTYISSIIYDTKTDLERQFMEQLILSVKNLSDQEIMKSMPKLFLEMEIKAMLHLDSQLEKFKSELELLMKQELSKLVLNSQIKD